MPLAGLSLPQGKVPDLFEIAIQDYLEILFTLISKIPFLAQITHSTPLQVKSLVDSW